MEFNQNPNQDQTKVPPPPTPEVSIRTLGSDRQSVASGDPLPTPEVVVPKSAPMPAMPSAPMSAVPEAASGITMLSDEEPAKAGGKKMLWLIITVVVFVALAAVGYFVVYPMISSSTDEATTEAAPTPEPTPAPVITRVHTSNFITPATFQATAKLATLTQAEIKAAISAQDASAPLGELTEVVMQDSTGNQIAFADYIAALAPSFVSASPVNAWLEDDFTAFVFKNDKGLWPGYVIRRQAAADATAFSAWVKALEQATAAEFFVSDPGALAAFKDGTVGTVKDRYATGAAGASFSYGVAGDYLVIATNFEGMKEALQLLGY